ncbi:MAG: hypothetical protein JSR60_04315 [Proteobacteria bacterium]|nr:hypothetical protein [Pseudomonadota bacterium]
MRRGWRIAAVVAVVPVALAATIGVTLAYPRPFFSYSVTEGRLTLYSDAPFDRGKARTILERVDARLKTSPLDDGAADAIYVANARWRQRLFFNIAYGAGGVNFYPWTLNVFLRQSNIDKDELLRPNGIPAEYPRTFTYYAAHEIGHSLTGRHLGFAHLWNWRLPQWIREG